MKINRKVFVEKILNAPDARMEVSDEKRRSKQMCLLLAGDKRTEGQLTLSDISRMFTDAEKLLEVFKKSLQDSFMVELLVDCARGTRRAL